MTDRQNPLDRFRVDGRRAVVTGGSKGIGAETALVLAQAGADVAIVGRDRAGLQETAARIQQTGRRCVIIEADMASVAGPAEAAAAALASFGTVDILVNNAGIARLDPLLTLLSLIHILTMINIVCHDAPVEFPWDHFFAGEVQ